MKGRGYEHHYKQQLPPKEGLQYQGSQLTPLARIKAKLPFNCDYCGLAFEKYACWAKRSKHNYCSRACSNAAKVIRFPKECLVCNTVMLLTPTLMKRVSTCSSACMRKKRTKNNSNTRSSPDYIEILKRLKKNEKCRSCQTTSGPWVVAGIRRWIEDGLSCANGDEAYLLCKNCHLKSVAHLSKNSTYMSDRFRYYKEKD